jgi:translation initiation factor IF-2
MTMRIVFQKDHEQYKKDDVKFIERTLAVKFCENGIALPFNTHQENIKREELARKEAEAKAKAEKEKAERLIAEKKKSEKEKADSKKPKQAERSIKK